MTQHVSRKTPYRQALTYAWKVRSKFSGVLLFAVEWFGDWATSRTLALPEQRSPGFNCSAVLSDMWPTTPHIPFTIPLMSLHASCIF